MKEYRQLVAEEPASASPMTSYADVMAYLHTINISREDMVSVGKQLLYEARNEHQAKALSRLDHLAVLPYDWDGYGAMPVSGKVIANLRRVVSLSRDADWEGWMISPEATGALCLQSKRRMSSISVGADEFSYYACDAEREAGEDHVAFTPRRLLNVMRKIV